MSPAGRWLVSPHHIFRFTENLQIGFSSPLRNQSRADLLPADRVLEGARHGNGTVEQSWESGVVGQPLGGGAGAPPLFLRPVQ